MSKELIFSAAAAGEENVVAATLEPSKVAFERLSAIRPAYLSLRD